jgi:hypothetical protein
MQSYYLLGPRANEEQDALPDHSHKRRITTGSDLDADNRDPVGLFIFLGISVGSILDFATNRSPTRTV